MWACETSTCTAVAPPPPNCPRPTQPNIYSASSYPWFHQHSFTAYSDRCVCQLHIEGNTPSLTGRRLLAQQPPTTKQQSKPLPTIKKYDGKSLRWQGIKKHRRDRNTMSYQRECIWSTWWKSANSQFLVLYSLIDRDRATSPVFTTIGVATRKHVPSSRKTSLCQDTTNGLELHASHAIGNPIQHDLGAKSDLLMYRPKMSTSVRIQVNKSDIVWSIPSL